MSSSSSSSSDAPETLRPLPVRLSKRADRDIEEARARFVALSGEPIGDAWMDALYRQLMQIGSTPEGYRIAEAESRKVGVELRETSFTRPGSTAAYRVYYTIVADDRHALAAIGDPPFVLILHVRHAARRTLTRAEARALARTTEETEEKTEENEGRPE